MIDSNDVKVGELDKDGYRSIKLPTSSYASVDFRYYYAEDAKKAVIWVGGIGGGWDTPAKGLYPALSRKLLIMESARYEFATVIQETLMNLLRM